MPGRVLIVYGTRFGATAGTVAVIAEVLRREGLEVTIVDSRREKVSDITKYDLVVVGSGMMMNKWTKGPEKFLDKFHRQLKDKKLALFVSSGGLATLELQGDTEEIESTRYRYLAEKAEKHGLSPVAMTMFGGVWDFNRMPWWAGMAKKGIKQQLDELGLKETAANIYDTRDWSAIRNWARELVGLVAEPAPR